MPVAKAVEFDSQRGRICQVDVEFNTQSLVGHPISVSNNYQGLDEVRANDPELVADYVRMRHIAPCPQYQARQRLFAERVAYCRSLE